MSVDDTQPLSGSEATYIEDVYKVGEALENLGFEKLSFDEFRALPEGSSFIYVLPPAKRAGPGSIALVRAVTITGSDSSKANLRTHAPKKFYAIDQTSSQAVYLGQSNREQASYTVYNTSVLYKAKSPDGMT